MAIFSYTFATLETAIKNFTEDDSTEFDAVIDDIMGLGELRIYRDIDLDFTRKHATVTGSASDQYLAKPTDFISVRHLYHTISGTLTHMIPKEVSWIRDYHSTVATEGTPLYYASWDNDTFVIAPTPDASLAFTLEYTYRPSRLISGNTTTWLGTNAPDLLLFACLCESTAFLQELGQGQEPGMYQVWENKYEQAKQRIIDEEIRSKRKPEFRHGEDR